MQEFMLYIRNRGKPHSGLSPKRHKQFLQACEVYIDRLKQAGKLIAAQPLARQGRVISGQAGAWREETIEQQAETQVGYYHIFARDLADAVALAKENPEFEYGTGASIEVRPVKTQEETTGYVYPKKV